MDPLTKAQSAALQAQRERALTEDQSMAGPTSGYSQPVKPGKTKEEIQKDKETDIFLQRFDEQSCLMLNLQTIVAANNAQYTQFAPVMSDSAYSFINHLFNREAKNKNYGKLLELNSAQLSALIPRIKLYKQYVDLNSKKSYDVEFVFDNHLTEKSIQSMITTRKGRGDGVGIKSFSWEADGKTLAETSLFKAELVLYMQSMNDLFVTRDTISNPIKSALENGQLNSKTLNIKYLDLIMQPPTFRKTPTEGPRVYNNEYFRIKINVGWQVLKNEGIFDKETINLLESLNETFFLTIYSHDLKFDEQGGVTLAINYRSYTETLISDPSVSNIFILPEELKKLEETKSEKQDKGTQQSDNEKKQLDEIDNKITNLKTEMYQEFLKNIIKENKIKLLEIDVSEYNSLMKIAAQYTENPTYEQVEKMAAAQKQIKYANETMKVSETTTEQNTTLSEDADKKVKQSTQPAGTPQTPETKKETTPIQQGTYQIKYFYLGDLLEVILRKLYNPEGEDNASFLKKHLRTILGPITFYDYGTLEDSGNAFFIQGTKQKKLVTYFTGKITTVNIADIPISLNLYNTWFVKEIIEPGYVNYTVKQFIESIINNLVITAIGKETNLPIPTQKVNLSYKTVTVPKNPTREIIFSNPISVGQDESTMVSSEQNLNEYQEANAMSMVDQVSAGAQQSSVPTAKTFYRSTDFGNTPFIVDLRNAGSGMQENLQNYLIIYGSSEKSWRKRDSDKADKKSGIYTMIYGASSGLVKKINFEKQDMPELNASLIHKAYVEQKGESTLLRGVYKANVEMFGNTLYELGSIVYIHPYLPGFSTDVSVAEKQILDLGIGGYYTVVGVNHDINLSTYTTKLKLMWNSRGDTGKVDIGKYQTDRVYKISDITSGRTSVGMSSVGKVEAIIGPEIE